jgi:DNA mismatch repair protein MutS2
MSASSPLSADLQARSLESLDWARVLESLAERCATTTGAALCLDLHFVDSPAKARRRLQEVGEMMALMSEGIAPSIGGIQEIRPHLEAARKGAILDGPSLLEVAHTLEGFQRLQDGLRDRAETAPSVWGLGQALHPLPDLAAWLLSSFDSRGELSTSTYPQLQQLRSRKARLHGQIRETIDSLKGEERFTDALMDDYSTLRNDRYVLPVKASSKRAGLGIVHDASGSGQTVYIEPHELIELNNDLKMAEAELEREQRRILRDLSERLATVGSDIAHSMDAAVILDVVSAKARFGVELNCSIQEVDDKATFAIKQGRHPVLCIRGLEVIANDLTLGGTHRALVLSGPNTGGKTVTLKTLGLAALMTRAAVPFPCEEGSVIGWFPHVLTDIGDKQDVEGDLSTFSGHVLALKEMLEALDERTDGAASLVLLDEIAVGTDPVQGAALGRAVLEGFIERGAVLATTTHYSEVKALGAQDDRFQGGRVEFDGAAGRPTYRLTLGRPGSSHALDVASRIGLDDAIMGRARELLDPTAASVEDLLSGLETEVAKARKARKDAEALRDRAQQELADADAERRRLEKRIREVEIDVKADFEKEVEGYRASVRGAMKRLREQADQRAAEQARQRITDGAHGVRERMGGAADPMHAEVDWSAAKIGDRVRIVSMDKIGELIELPDRKGRVTVSVGGLPVQLKKRELEVVRGGPVPKSDKGRRGGSAAFGRKQKKRTVAADDTDPKTAFRGPDNTITLIGQRVDEALSNLDRYLDGAALDGRPWVFVVHGHGTGALRDAVREHLRTSPYVAESARGTRSQGGEAVTVARLR